MFNYFKIWQKFLEHMHDKKRKEVGLVATISSIFALRTCGIAMCLCINMNDQIVVLHIIRLWIEDEYVINHVLCLVTRFIPFPVTKRRQKFSWMCFSPAIIITSIQFLFLSTHFIIMILKLGILLRGKQIIVIVVNVHIQLLFVAVAKLLLIWFCGSNM